MYKKIKQKINTDTPEYQIFAWWPYIEDKKILNLPLKCTINFHPSYLPYGKGKDPNFWAIINRHPFGVSIHKANESIDSGEIIIQKQIIYSWEDTGKSLYKKAIKEILVLSKKIYPSIRNNKFKLKKNKATKINYRSQIYKASQIILNKKYKAANLLNIIRAKDFSPYPGAWFEENGSKFEVKLKIKKIE